MSVCDWRGVQEVRGADNTAPQTPTGIQVIQVSDFYQRAGILQYAPRMFPLDSSKLKLAL